MAVNDSEIRSILFNFFKNKYPDYLLKEEVNISSGFVRTDVILLGDFLYGIEIKGETDTLKRLQKQTICYSSFFDKCYLTCTPNHLEGSLVIIPPWWGVLLIDDGKVKVYRKSEVNINNCIYNQVELLSDESIYDILYFLSIKYSHLEERSSLIEKIFHLGDLNDIKSLVKIKLKKDLFNNPCT